MTYRQVLQTTEFFRFLPKTIETRDELSDAQFNSMMEKGLLQAKANESKPAKEVFANLRKRDLYATALGRSSNVLSQSEHSNLENIAQKIHSEFSVFFRLFVKKPLVQNRKPTAFSVPQEDSNLRLTA